MYRILIVDDDIDLLSMVKLFLQLNNFAVQTIHKWEDIQASIKSFNPNLILLDITLGLADGRLICKQLKREDGNKNISIVLFSAKYDVNYTFAEYLADGFISKPFDPKTLINKIHSVLSGNPKGV
jgi:DNA-binding response OmpR family regulator